MPSKFIKNSRLTNQPKTYEWYSMGNSKQAAEEKREMEEYRQKMKSEKARVEAIPLEELSFTHIYTMPFVDRMGMGRIYSGDNFVFQFLGGNEATQQTCLQILNGELKEYKRQNITQQNGEILIDGHPFILVRGWGQLCGGGAYNLNEKWAARIQDSLEEYIVEKLSK